LSSTNPARNKALIQNNKVQLTGRCTDKANSEEWITIKEYTKGVLFVVWKLVWLMG